MTAVDRNWALSLLCDAKSTEDSRFRFYATQPYPAMTIIAAERAHTLELLIEAIADGLLEQLQAKDEKRAAEHLADNGEDEEIEKYDEPTSMTNTDVRAVFAEPVAGRDFDEMPEATIVPRSLAEIQAIEAAELAEQGPHRGRPDCEGCPECIGYPDPNEPDDDELTIHDVMTATELYEADRDAEFRLDAADYADSLEQWDAQRGEL